VDEYVMDFHEPMHFDESTIRKKLKEYEGEGIIRTEKQGRRVLYSRTEDIDLRPLLDVIDFFGEAAPCGVVGSFLRDKEGLRDRAFRFKHNYLTQATDSDVLACLFDAMQQKRYITADYLGKRSGQVFKLHLVPLRIYISAQNGRQNLLAYEEKSGRVGAYRPEYLSAVKVAEPCEKFDELRDYLGRLEKNMWGVNCKRSIDRMEHVEFEVFVGRDEQHIVQRLEREKRCGRVEQVDEHHYRYVADVFGTVEMVPWIRTFLCRITKLNLSDRTLENRFEQEIEEMYRMYGIDGGDGDAV
jgi:DNA-binding transcriptional ArsR family regulator